MPAKTPAGKMSQEDAARRLDVSIRTLWRWSTSDPPTGPARHKRDSDGAVWYEPVEVEHFATANGYGPAATGGAQ